MLRAFRAAPIFFLSAFLGRDKGKQDAFIMTLEAEWRRKAMAEMRKGKSEKMNLKEN